MKFITKRHKAEIIQGNSDGQLDFNILDEGEQVKEESLEIKNSSEITEYNRLMNECMNENSKFKRIALFNAKLGDKVVLQVKYLVE